jgi:hypothetical protein
MGSDLRTSASYQIAPQNVVLIGCQLAAPPQFFVAPITHVFVYGGLFFAPSFLHVDLGLSYC